MQLHWIAEQNTIYGLYIPLSAVSFLERKGCIVEKEINILCDRLENLKKKIWWGKKEGGILYGYDD